MKKNPIFFYSLSLVTVLFIVALIIFGFDISTPKNSRKAINEVVKNQSTKNYFYQINEEYAFGVFTDRAAGEMDVIITAYEKDIIPYCFFCGWNTASKSNDRRIMQPYLSGDFAYDIEVNETDYGGVPAGEFATLNLKTGEFGHVKDLNTISDSPTDVSKRITREFVSENYDEMSFSSSDDEDCYITFSALFVCYFILLIWGQLILVRRKK